MRQLARGALAQWAAARSAAGLASVAVLLAAACGGAPGESDANTATSQNPRPATGVFFPERLPGGDDMLAELSGKLVVDDRGCLRVEHDGASHTVVWPAGYEVEKADGKTRMIDGKGEVVARAGQPVSMGGGETPLGDNRTVDKPTLRELRERCPGSYWVATAPVRMPGRG